MKKIIFVCHGNICRSPMAEFVMKDLVKKANLQNDFFITSKATSTEEIGNGIHYGTINELKKHNIPIDSHFATQITKDDYDKFDFIICMDDNNLRNLAHIVGSDRDNKIFLLLEFTNLDFMKLQENAKLSKNQTRLNLQIADPWYSGDFAKTYDDIYKGCRAFLKFIIYKF